MISGSGEESVMGWLYDLLSSSLPVKYTLVRVVDAFDVCSLTPIVTTSFFILKLILKSNSKIMIINIIFASSKIITIYRKLVISFGIYFKIGHIKKEKSEFKFWLSFFRNKQN